MLCLVITRTPNPKRGYDLLNIIEMLVAFTETNVAPEYKPYFYKQISDCINWCIEHYGNVRADTHPNNKITKLFKGNVYDWFTSQIFCDGEHQFRERFGASAIFGNDAIDTKEFLENQFNIKL